MGDGGVEQLAGYGHGLWMVWPTWENRFPKRGQGQSVTTPHFSRLVSCIRPATAYTAYTTPGFRRSDAQTLGTLRHASMLHRRNPVSYYETTPFTTNWCYNRCLTLTIPLISYHPCDMSNSVFIPVHSHGPPLPLTPPFPASNSSHSTFFVSCSQCQIATPERQWRFLHYNLPIPYVLCLYHWQGRGRRQLRWRRGRWMVLMQRLRMILRVLRVLVLSLMGHREFCS